MSLPEQYQTAEGLRTLANYLRGQNGVKVRSGIEHEKRVEYFKGKKLVECILEAKKWPKSIPVITDKAVARLVAGALIQSSFFHRSEKVEDKKGYLKISQRNVFEETGYYTWMYSGNMMWSNIATFLVIAVVIVCTLMPIWPVAAKQVLWYCSVTFLIVIFSLLIMRAAAFVIMWLLGYEFWVFPRLFDESLSFQDSFVPIYTFEKGSAGQGYYRLGGVLLLGGFIYWACTQPTEFDGFLKAQTDFIDDLYTGKLLADVAHDSTAHLDRTKRVPSLEDLLKAMEADEKEKIGDSEGAGAGEDSFSPSDLQQRAEDGMGSGAGTGEWVKLEEEVARAASGGGDAGDDDAEGEGQQGGAESHADGADQAAESATEDASAEAEEAEWTAPDYQQEEEEQQHDEM